jgi:hypothetical protein
MQALLVEDHWNAQIEEPRWRIAANHNDCVNWHGHLARATVAVILITNLRERSIQLMIAE